MSSEDPLILRYANITYLHFYRKGKSQGFVVVCYRGKSYGTYQKARVEAM